MKNNTLRRRFATIALAAALAFTAVPATMPAESNIATVKAATTSIITGGEGTVTTSLTTGEKCTVTISDCELKVTVGLKSTTFKIGNRTAVAGMAKVEADDLLHIFTLSGHYYVIDLQYGQFTTIQAHYVGLVSTGKYVSASTSGAIACKGSSFIAGTNYFNAVDPDTGKDKERKLITRTEFSEIVNPTPTPDPEPQPNPNTNTDADKTIDSHTEINSETHTDIHSETKITAEWWVKEYDAGKITWEQLMEALSKFAWTVNSNTTNASESIEYYIYNDKGQLVTKRTVTTGTSQTTENGSGTTETKASTSGTANVEVKKEENGGAKATAETNATVDSKTKTTIDTHTEVREKETTKTTTTKTKATYNEWHNNKKTVLTMTKDGKTSNVISIAFNRKKGTFKFNGKTYKNIKDLGFTQKSLQIIAIDKKGKVYIIPRAKGKAGVTYSDKKLKGTWKKLNRANSRLVNRVVNGKGKTLGVQKEQPTTKKTTTKKSSKK